MKNKKAFTLVELLAVIVILAVILVIAIPQIMNTIKTARISSFKDSAMLIAEQAEKDFLSQQVLNPEYNVVTIPCEDVAKLNDDYDICNIRYNNGIATVTLKGADGGKFSGITCTGTKDNMTCTNTNDSSSESGEVATVITACGREGKLHNIDSKLNGDAYIYSYGNTYFYLNDGNIIDLYNMSNISVVIENPINLNNVNYNLPDSTLKIHVQPSSNCVNSNYISNYRVYDRTTGNERALTNEEKQAYCSGNMILTSSISSDIQNGKALELEKAGVIFNVTWQADSNCTNSRYFTEHKLRRYPPDVEPGTPGYDELSYVDWTLAEKQKFCNFESVDDDDYNSYSLNSVIDDYRYNNSGSINPIEYGLISKIPSSYDVDSQTYNVYSSNSNYFANWDNLSSSSQEAYLNGETVGISIENDMMKEINYSNWDSNNSMNEIFSNVLYEYDKNTLQNNNIVVGDMPTDTNNTDTKGTFFALIPDSTDEKYICTLYDGGMCMKLTDSLDNMKTKIENLFVYPVSTPSCGNKSQDAYNSQRRIERNYQSCLEYASSDEGKASCRETYDDEMNNFNAGISEPGAGMNPNGDFGCDINDGSIFCKDGGGGSWSAQASESSSDYLDVTFSSGSLKYPYDENGNNIGGGYGSSSCSCNSGQCSCSQ